MHHGFDEQWIQAIQESTFVPQVPLRLPKPQIRTRAQPLLSPQIPDCGRWSITAASTNQDRVLTLAYPRRSENERLILVIDTLTHMHKQDLSGFTLDPLNIGGQNIHAASFVLPADLISTVGIIRTRQKELTASRSRSQWKEFFDRTEPLSVRENSPIDPAVASVLSLPESSLLVPGAETVSLKHSTVDCAGIEGGIELALHLPRSPENLLLITDGATYLKRYPLVSKLNQNQAAQHTAVLFITPAQAADRNPFLGQPGTLANWLKQTGLPWLAQHMPTPEANRCIISGSSLGGLAAARLLREAPDIVRRAIVQSAALWWISDGSQQEGKELLSWSQDIPHPGLDIFLEVGKYEGYLLSWNREFRRLLKYQGTKHSYREFTGGHDYACWQRGIIAGMNYHLTHIYTTNSTKTVKR